MGTEDREQRDTRTQDEVPGNEDQRTGLGLGEDGNERQQVRVLEVGRAGGLEDWGRTRDSSQGVTAGGEAALVGTGEKEPVRRGLRGLQMERPWRAGSCPESRLGQSGHSGDTGWA